MLASRSLGLCAGGAGARVSAAHAASNACLWRFFMLDLRCGRKPKRPHGLEARLSLAHYAVAAVACLISWGRRLVSAEVWLELGGEAAVVAANGRPRLRSASLPRSVAQGEGARVGAWRRRRGDRHRLAAATSPSRTWSATRVCARRAGRCRPWRSRRSWPPPRPPWPWLRAWQRCGQPGQRRGCKRQGQRQAAKFQRVLHEGLPSSRTVATGGMLACLHVRCAGILPAAMSAYQSGWCSLGPGLVDMSPRAWPCRRPFMPSVPM